MAGDMESRIRNITAVLGPTNTGKTHLAIERMIGHDSGIIGLPLRLLAREVYDKIAGKIGAEHVALVTGEEKIKPDKARYWVATVEAMPTDLDVEFVAVDEVQLAGDPDRGHVFTDRILHARGKSETLLLGAQTMHDAISDLIPGANFVSRPRLSQLNYSGQKKITRIPARSAVIAFSASEVYAIAELIRRQRGGTAVVLGALSPRTRNAQVDLYQSGEVDFLVATDAIGMGLNLDVDHVAFSSLRKFDGAQHRDLLPAELGQIAGRAGRHMNDGTFGVTGDCPTLDPELVERLESHAFDSVRMLQWRNRFLDFSSLTKLKDSLREAPTEARLARARSADDELALEALSRDEEILVLASEPGAVDKLWDVCQIPDYRKISHQNHAELVGQIFKFITGETEVVPEDWFAEQVAFSDRVDGDIDTLSTRLAHIRTWTYVSNRTAWLKDPAHWQGRTRDIEDRLSDALHERLTQRFVDERTSALMRGMRDKAELSAEIGEDGSILVENHPVGRLQGFCFHPEGQTDDIHGRTARGAAAQVLSRELALRVRRVVAAPSDAFSLDQNGSILWRSESIAQLERGEDPLKPSMTILCDEHLSAAERDKIKARLETWLNETINDKLKPLIAASTADDIDGLAKGVAFQLREGLGTLRREDVASEIKNLDQKARAQLRKHGVRFGAFNIYFPVLLKPAPAHLTSVLWMLKNSGETKLDRRALPKLPRAGLTSVAADTVIPEAYYRAYGYHVCGPRALRIDILERLADLIRPLVAWRQKSDSQEAPPNGASGDGGFTATPDMMSILGCSAEELGATLRALGFESERRPKSNVPLAQESKPDQNSVTAELKTDVSQMSEGGATAPATVTEAMPTVAPDTSAASLETSVEPEPDGTESQAAAESSAPNAERSAPDAKDDDFEDVWRPVRRHRPRRRTGHARQGGGDGKGSANNAADTTASERSRKTDEGRKSVDRRASKPNRDGAQRNGLPHGKSQHGKQHDGKPHRGKPRSGKSSPRSKGPKVHHSAPPRSETSDASSPFAALSGLRAELEKSRKGS
ncbi:MAG: helicase [Alphaproteobacteria bacterium]|nr:helicase [Alphaproteobacteria bacterium]